MNFKKLLAGLAGLAVSGCVFSESVNNAQFIIFNTSHHYDMTVDYSVCYYGLRHSGDECTNHALATIKSKKHAGDKNYIIFSKNNLWPAPVWADSLTFIIHGASEKNEQGVVVSRSQFKLLGQSSSSCNIRINGYLSSPTFTTLILTDMEQSPYIICQSIY